MSSFSGPRQEREGHVHSIVYPARVAKEDGLNLITKAWRYLRHGPSHLVMYVFGRFSFVRYVAVQGHRLQNGSHPRNGGARTDGRHALECVDVDHAAHAIRKSGYFAGLRLREETLENLRRFAATSTCFVDGDPRIPFVVSERLRAEQSYQRKIRIGRFDPGMQSCPEVQDLVSDPTILGIASDYLSCRPVLLGTRIWWSFPTKADAEEQMSLGQGFHYDLDGYASVAFFFYLTDVDATSGPHVVVRGSHKRKPWRGLLSPYKGRQNADIEKWYGRENQVMLCGSAGSGFAEDLFCYHKGMHPENGERLVLQLRYGIRRYYRD